MDCRECIWFLITWLIMHSRMSIEGCTFSAQNGIKHESESVRFIRVREDLPVGSEIVEFQPFPRTSITLWPAERNNAHKFFRVHEVNVTTSQILLNKSLDSLVDIETPQNLLKFKIVCTGNNGRDEEISFLSVAVYIEDINDHAPEFPKKLYVIYVEEATSVGAAIYEDIKAFDRDKPNTPNSDIYYTLEDSRKITGGPFFSLESPHKALVILRKPLDYDAGIREFKLRLTAIDRGTPSQSANTTLKIYVTDNDDLPPKFTERVYRTKINEFYPLTANAIRVPLYFSPRIMAFDQDALNYSITYKIIAGNERNLFQVDPTTGTIFLIKEVDLEEESLPGNTIVLQIEATQTNDPIMHSLARIEIEIIDLNDNAPEFEVDFYNISIVENLPNGFSVLQVNAYDRDQDENAEFYYNLFEENPNGAFAIDVRTGWLTVRDQSLLDHETRITIHLTVQAIERITPYESREPSDLSKVKIEISLIDSNDNSPQFENGNLYTFKTSVNATVGTVIGQLVAKDPDNGPNGMVLYKLQRPKGSEYVPFRLDTKTGDLIVTGSLRRGRIALFVEASDQPINPSERRFTLAVVAIEINATFSQEKIEFSGAPYEFWVGHDVPIGTSVGHVRTTLDYEDKSEITFDLLHSYIGGVPFAIEERSGIITVVRDLDNFDNINYFFEAVANYKKLNLPESKIMRKNSRSQKKVTKSGDVLEIDEGIVSNIDGVLVTNVTVHVVNSQAELRVRLRKTGHSPIEFHVKENLPGVRIGYLHEQGIANDGEYKKENSLAANTFSSSVGRRRHLHSNYQRNVTNDYPTTTGVYHDPLAHDQKPTFSFIPLTFQRAATWKPSLSQTSSAGLYGASTNLSREIEQSDEHANHKRRIVNEYNVRTYSTSEDNPFIKETKLARNWEEVSRKVAKHDKPKLSKYYIANQQEVLNKIEFTNDGSLITLAGLDREERDTYILTVIAEHSQGLTSEATLHQVVIHVEDVNDNPPLFDSEVYSGIIYENSKIGTEVLVNRPIKVRDADAGENADFHVSLSGEGSNKFVVDFVNATSFSDLPPTSESDKKLGRGFKVLELLLKSLNKFISNEPHYRIKFVGSNNIDREENQLYHLQLHAKDLGGLTSAAELNILVADTNDNAPIFKNLGVFDGYGIEILEYTDNLEIYWIQNKTGTFINHGENTGVGSSVVAEEFPRMITNSTSFGTSSAKEIEKPIEGSNKESSRKRKRSLISILESTPIGVPIIKVTATDRDYDRNAQITYHITSEKIVSFQKKKPKSMLLNIDQLSGEIRVNHALEAETEIMVNITAKDIGDLFDMITVYLKVLDVNNNAPVFKKQWYSFDLLEGVYFDTQIGRVEATDADYAENGNISYSLEIAEDFLFNISSGTGILVVSGDLDREVRSHYKFHVVAKDSGPEGKMLSSTVLVEINVRDLNDNVPEFVDYDDIIISKEASMFNKIGHLHIKKSQVKIPVYKVYLNRKTASGGFVKQITALDKDFIGNGNGLVMYSLLHHLTPHCFEIDSKTGVINTISSMSAFNRYEFINLTIVASDFGSPSLSSTAILLVNLQGQSETIQEKMGLFSHKYYEILLKENNPYPISLIQFNVSAMYDAETFKWSIVPEFQDVNYVEPFAINPENGTLFAIASLDREAREIYRLKIKAKNPGREVRSFSTLTYPIGDDFVYDLQEDEIRVVIKITDVNDNPPKFKDAGRPIVAVIPCSANFGFPVASVEAFDADEGFNAEIRYKLLNEHTRLFGIDERTGKIRLLGPVNVEQHLYGFDVKAIDKGGAAEGRSSIANMLVYVLDENKQVRLVISGNPLQVEQQIDGLIKSISGEVGMDIRVRSLEPHNGGEEPATDVYIYAVNPKTNTIISMEDLQSVISDINMEIIAQPKTLHILEISEVGRYRSNHNEKTAVLMSSAELASVILAVTVFAGSLATSLCVLCIRCKRGSPNGKTVIPRQSSRQKAGVCPIKQQKSLSERPSIDATGQYISPKFQHCCNTLLCTECLDGSNSDSYDDSLENVKIKKDEGTNHTQAHQLANIQRNRSIKSDSCLHLRELNQGTSRSCESHSLYSFCIESMPHFLGSGRSHTIGTQNTIMDLERRLHELEKSCRVNNSSCLDVEMENENS